MGSDICSNCTDVTKDSEIVTGQTKKPIELARPIGSVSCEPDSFQTENHSPNRMM